MHKHQAGVNKMDNKVLKTAFLFPDILCLNGDRGNIYAIRDISKKLGVDMTVDRIDSPDTLIDFDAYDICYIPSGELKYVISTAQALGRQIDGIKKAVADGKIFIITGTSMALFANKIIRDDKSEYPSLCIGDFTCIERTEVYGDDLVYNTDVYGGNLTITACQISLINTILDSDVNPLGKVVYGYGNNGGADEGVIIRNCVLTNALGPLLVKNPRLTTQIIKQALKNKGIDTGIQEIEFETEDNSAKRIWQFIEQKINK